MAQKFQLFNWTCDLDLDQMTLILKFDLDLVVTYLHTKMRSIGQGVQQLWPENKDTQTYTI